MLGILTGFVFYWVGSPSIIESLYSSSLTAKSQTYSQDCASSNYHYESIEVNVITNGSYKFISLSRKLDAVGYIYKENFNPMQPYNENSLFKSERLCIGCDIDYDFQLIADLQPNTTYVLVVTTFYPSQTGAFSIFVLGPNNVSFTRISEYLYYFVNNQHRKQNTENIYKLNFYSESTKRLIFRKSSIKYRTIFTGLVSWGFYFNIINILYTQKCRRNRDGDSNLHKNQYCQFRSDPYWHR